MIIDVAAMFIVLASAMRPAAAHQSSVKYVELAVEDRGIAVRVRTARADLTTPLNITDEREPTGAEVLAQRDAVGSFVVQWFEVAVGGAPCQPQAITVAIDADPRFVAVQ